MIEHARYIAWANRFTRATNAEWMAGHYPLEPLMTRAGLDFHLFAWAVRKEYITEPEDRRVGRAAALGQVLAERREEVEAEAERYVAGLRERAERVLF